MTRREEKPDPRKEQVWVHKITGEIKTVHWNPCGCCRNYTVETWGTHSNKRGAYYYNDILEFNEAMKKRNYVFLGNI